ncbi:thiamine diphosphokinase [Granulicatella seriolae]|uniref:Thiamine diphosphokinase n=1 Tax=Granulicatella seriolae TaxID=2967226 RepID=A0ABT1WMJ1_9LACT|nr:thiamine diphosphokinase [Granulicatella seriolae]
MDIFVVLGGPEPQLREILENKYAQMNRNQQIFIGVDGGCLQLLDASLPIELAIGDFDSINVSEKEMIRQLAKQMIELQAEKDDTDTEAALKWVMKHYPKERVHLIGAFGGRIDHQLSNVWLILNPTFKDLIPYLIIENAKNDCRFLSPASYEIDKLKGANYLSFISYSSIKALTLEGVKYPLNRVDYAYPIALISNEFKAGQTTMKVSFEEGLLMVAQTKD